MRLLYVSTIQLGNKDDMTQWVVLCIGVLATLYLVMRGRTRAKRGDPLARAASVGMSLSQQRQVERDISNLMVEMLETARQMTAQLDTRAARLEALIVEAEAKLEALRGAVAVTGSSISAAAPTQVSQTDDGVAPAGSTVEISVPPNAAVDPPAEVVADAAPAPEMKPETPPDPRHAEVYALADQGRSPGEIARRLNRPNGEVELILALRRN